MFIIYALIAIFLIVAVFMLFGKGSWLIAGYNTASEEEKEKYDVKKLCRSMGVFLILLCVILGLTAYVNTDAFALKMLLPIFALVGVELFYANKFCYKK